MESSGHTHEDIIFIGSILTGHKCTWEEFVVLSDKEYYSGYGSSEVGMDLSIHFSDGTYMYRREYDGSEWWAYTLLFKEPKNTHTIHKLCSKHYARTLEEIQSEGTDE